MDTFALDIAKFAEKTETKIEDASRLIVLSMFVTIVQETPVKHGRAKGSWTSSIYTLPSVYAKINDKTGTRTIKKIENKVDKWKCDGSIFLASNVEYMPYLEYGPHSKQAPKGMVRVTIADFQDTVNSVVRQVK